MISVLGSINLDMIATGSRLPAPGETVSAAHFKTAAGGKGANQALAAARAGGDVNMVGAVGSDDFVTKALAELKGARVDLSRVVTVPGPTGLAIILVDRLGENVIVIVAGANGLVSAEMAQKTVAGMAENDILIMVQEIAAATLKAGLMAANEKGVTTLLNIAPITPETPELALMADIIVANETEFSHLSGGAMDKDSILGRAQIWAKQFNKTLVVTLGGDGAIAATPTQVISVDALDITPVDSVGAGDSFCGYLGAGLDQGLSLKEALHRAAIAGSLACLKPGAQPAIPNVADVTKAMQPKH